MHLFNTKKEAYEFGCNSGKAFIMVCLSKDLYQVIFRDQLVGAQG